MFNLPLYLRPGSLIVFEGLDNTGKSTQLERFARAVHAPDLGEPLYAPAPMFTHQPSGATGLGPDIYDLTEEVDWRRGDPLTRQYLHLAAHREHWVHDIAPALQLRSVVMDRCWWSTVAYGYQGSVAEQFTFQEFIKFANTPEHQHKPDLVFLFLQQYDVDTASVQRAAASKTVRENYSRLHDIFWASSVMVPRLPRGETTAFIAGELKRRGLVEIKED